MTIIIRRQPILGIRLARAVLASRDQLLGRPSGRRSSGTIRTKAPASSGSDAFLHVSVVERSGNSSVPPGATLEVRVEPGQKGTQVTEIISIDASTALSEPPRCPRPERPYAPADQASVEEIGTVKWYNSAKGFGFIVRDRGGKDIFLHASALSRGGLSEVAEGQRVAVDMIEGFKGPEAVGIRLL